MADDEKRNDPPWGKPLDPSDMEREGGADEQETRPREVPQDQAAQDTPPSGTPVPEDIPYYPPPPPPGETVRSEEPAAPEETRMSDMPPPQEAAPSAQPPEETRIADVPQ